MIQASGRIQSFNLLGGAHFLSGPVLLVIDSVDAEANRRDFGASCKVGLRGQSLETALRSAWKPI